MKITSVERHKKKKDMLLVYIDDNYSFSITEEDYLRHNLYEEKELDDAEIEFIKVSINFRSAKSFAVKYLSIKLRSERELLKRLEEEGFDKETIDHVAEELKALGYINDKIYAQKYVYDRSKLKPKSKRLLRYELGSKGVSEEVLDEVLNGWEIDEITVAKGLIKKKFGKYDLNDEKVLNKVKLFLHHRGFDFNTIESAIKGIDNDL